MGRAKLKLRAAQRYVPAAAQVETDRGERRASTVEFLPLELPQEPQVPRRQAAGAAPPKKTKPCLVEAPTPSECWSQPPVTDAESKREAVEGKEEATQLDGDALGRDDSARCVYCLPRVTLRRPDGVAVDVMAAALAGGGPAGAEASLHLGEGRRLIDPWSPVLYMDVHGGRMRLEGRVVTTHSAHVATLSVSKGAKGEEREVRLRDRLPGVVVFHRLEWLGSVDDNSKEEARAFPDSIEVEVRGFGVACGDPIGPCRAHVKVSGGRQLPLDAQQGNFGAGASEQFAADITEQPRNRQQHEGDGHQGECGVVCAVAKRVGARANRH